jgi:uncharacterized caspase-like protein
MLGTGISRYAKWIALAALAVHGAAFAAGPRVDSGGERRLALVIGNSEYRYSPIKNPVNDARAVADSLKALGFEVILRENTGMAAMLESIRDFSMRARNSDVRLLYYAGHGIQTKGKNYLIPVDAEIQSEDEIPGKSADLTELIDRLGALGSGLNIVILDACRNNPFKDTVALASDGRRLKFRGATPSGLAAVNAPLGTLVAFSTAPGAVAMDGVGGTHSLYTKHLLANIEAPGLPLEQLFKRVRAAVAQETQRVQVPWESSSLMGDFCFRLGAGGTCAASASLFMR